jgi:transposase
MIEPEHLQALSREDLLALVAELARQIAALTASHEALRAEIDQLAPGGKRQAAPFSTGTRVADPKPPGRQPGSGTFRSREAPPPEAITVPPVDVKVTFEMGPKGGGKLAEERVDFASTTELSPIPWPRVRPYRGWVCRCTRCGTQVRGQPPDLALDPYGATDHRLEERGRAAAQVWHDGVGLPGRKVPAVLHALTGVRRTPGAITQDAQRRAAGAVGTTDRRWRTAVPEAPVVHTDATGWCIGASLPT